MVQIGRFDIRFSVSSLKCFLPDPREGHLKQLVSIFIHFYNTTGRRESIVIQPENIREIIGKGDNSRIVREVS